MRAVGCIFGVLVGLCVGIVLGMVWDYALGNRLVGAITMTVSAPIGGFLGWFFPD